MHFINSGNIKKRFSEIKNFNVDHVHRAVNHFAYFTCTVYILNILGPDTNDIGISYIPEYIPMIFLGLCLGNIPRAAKSNNFP